MLFCTEAVELLAIFLPQACQVGDRNTDNAVHGINTIVFQDINQQMEAISQFYIFFVTHEQYLSLVSFDVNVKKRQSTLCMIRLKRKLT